MPRIIFLITYMGKLPAYFEFQILEGFAGNMLRNMHSNRLVCSIRWKDEPMMKG